MKDKEYDQLLRVKTRGMREWQSQSIHYNPYEATPYEGLNELFQGYELKPTDRFVDFGCGKGRLLFYIHHHYRLSVTGIEVNQQLYQEAMDNRAEYMKRKKRPDGVIQFECCPAEKYEIKPKENRFYFFNPFSVQIFMKVVHNILLSIEECKRSVDLLLYYPTIEYIHFLEMNTPFQLLKKIKATELYEKDKNEHFLIFRHGE